MKFISAVLAYVIIFVIVATIPLVALMLFVIQTTMYMVGKLILTFNTLRK